jgi:signal transduction histidine kinase
MVGLTESTLNSTKTPAQFQQVLKQLLQQQKNLTDITNSLLLLSDGNNEGANKNYPLERLDELIFRTAEIMEGHFPDSSIEINVDGALVSENAFLLPGHEPMLMIAFGNLLKNALQYSSDKKAIINLDVSGKHKVVCFKNAGTAIPPEERHRIFTPFYRSLSTSTVKGHGLGLPLVQQIIRLHSGEVQYKYVHPFNVFTVTFL